MNDQRPIVANFERRQSTNKKRSHSDEIAISQRDALIGALYLNAKKDKDIIFLSADFGAPALDRYREDLADQFFHLGISEQNMIDVAIGLALKGKKVVTYAMAPFISMRCAEQHKIAAMMDLPIMNIIAGVGLGYANAGPTHYATEDLSLFTNIIGSTVYTLSDHPQAEALVDHYLANPHLCFVRLDRDLLQTLDPQPDFGRGYRELTSGKKVCVVTHGYATHQCMEIIKKNNLDDRVTLIDVFRSKPLPAGLEEKLAQYQNVVFVDEQIASSSIGQILCPEYVQNNTSQKIENIFLDEQFMFQNVGRSRLVELAGLSETRLLAAMES
jgi:transketolase